MCCQRWHEKICLISIKPTDNWIESNFSTAKIMLNLKISATINWRDNDKSFKTIPFLRDFSDWEKYSRLPVNTVWFNWTLYCVPSRVWTVPSLCSWNFWKIRDDFDVDGQLDSNAPPARSNPTARRRRNHLQFFKIFMNIGTELSIHSRLGHSIDCWTRLRLVCCSGEHGWCPQRPRRRSPSSVGSRDGSLAVKKIRHLLE